MTTKAILTVSIITLITIIIMKTTTIKKLSKLVAKQLIRTSDAYGSGHYGAKRTNHVHQGIDIITIPSENIFSPISGKITRFPLPYKDYPALHGIEIKNADYSVKMFYVDAILPIGTIVSAGQQIAIAQSLQVKYPKITNHLHLEVRNAKGEILNPTNLF